jgi:hypothetical protein
MAGAIEHATEVFVPVVELCDVAGPAEPPAPALLQRKRCSTTLGLSALQDGWSGCQFHGISSSMRF